MWHPINLTIFFSLALTDRHSMKSYLVLRATLLADDVHQCNAMQWPIKFSLSLACFMQRKVKDYLRICSEHCWSTLRVIESVI